MDVGYDMDRPLGFWVRQIGSDGTEIAVMVPYSTQSETSRELRDTLSSNSIEPEAGKL